jgi:hypothetical protein
MRRGMGGGGVLLLSVLPFSAKSSKIQKSSHDRQVENRDGSHRDNFCESLETLSAVRVTVVGFFLGFRFLSTEPNLWISLADTILY